MAVLCFPQVDRFPLPLPGQGWIAPEFVLNAPNLRLLIVLIAAEEPPELCVVPRVIQLYVTYLRMAVAVCKIDSFLNAFSSRAFVAAA